MFESWNMVEDTVRGINKSAVAANSNVKRKFKQSSVNKNFLKDKSILKLTLACAVLIGSSAFGNGSLAANVDINNGSSLENGINNNSYYSNGNVLNITDSIVLETLTVI